MKPKMKLKTASIAPETVNLDMKEQNARQGIQIAMTNLVKIVPVFSGISFFFVKMKPTRIKIMVLAMLIQSFWLDIAVAILVPISLLTNNKSDI